MASVVDRLRTVLVAGASDGKREAPIQIKPDRTILDPVPFAERGKNELLDMTFFARRAVSAEQKRQIEDSNLKEAAA